MQQGDVHQHGSHDPVSAPWWKTRSGVVLCGFLLVAAFYLLTEHTAAVFGVLPYLLILTCPLGGDSSAAIRRFERLDELTTLHAPPAACSAGACCLCDNHAGLGVRPFSSLGVRAAGPRSAS